MHVAYKPSPYSPKKYLTYARYFLEYFFRGDFKSIAASFSYVFLKRGPKEDYVTTTPMGEFLVRKGTNDFQFITNTYEKEVKKFLMERLGEFDVFIDAGACIGEYCIWLARQGKHCIAIEPVNYHAIELNVRMNDVQDKVQVFRYGLGDKPEKVHFNIHTDTTSSSCLDRNATGEPNVDIETLDNLCKKFKISATDRIIMKLDVEGMETEAIKGASRFIRACPNLTIIYEDYITDNFRNDKLLSKLGDFRFYNIDEINRVAEKR